MPAPRWLNCIGLTSGDEAAGSIILGQLGNGDSKATSHHPALTGGIPGELAGLWSVLCTDCGKWRSLGCWPCDTPESLPLPCVGHYLGTLSIRGHWDNCQAIHDVHSQVTKIAHNSLPSPVHCTRCPMPVPATAEKIKNQNSPKVPMTHLFPSRGMAALVTLQTHIHTFRKNTLGPQVARTPHNSSSRYLYTNLNSALRRFILSGDL